ncbi:MAG: LPXTG cell wall anchor domain-containing protein [Eubacterium sp.]|nr:LPXTG cell wall anchor domain-containing protein [Eubacterium sp.]
MKNESEAFECVSGHGLGEGGLIDLTTAAEKTFSGLSNGLYKLTETQVPAGYVIMTKDICFNLSNGAVTLTDETGNATGDGATYSSVTLADDNTTIVVKNKPGVSLPSTGGSGTARIYILGLLMLFGAGVVLAIGRRRTE